MLEIAFRFAKEWKLGFNHDKSSIMVVGKRFDKNKEWKLGCDTIREVNSYKYLGVIISSNQREHTHYEHVIQKGNRLIAYIKGIIANLDDFNRVYYGNILWKTIALPSINYACSIWYNKSNKDNENLEKIQIQMARFLLKAPRYTPKEALYGDLGWAPLSQLHEVAWSKLFHRFINMDAYRWPNIVLKCMLQLKCDFNDFKYKFLTTCVDIFEKCPDIDFYNHVFNFDNLTFNSFSVSTLKNDVSKWYKAEWSDTLTQKISLHNYSKLQSSPKLQKYLLDKTNFYGASIKFKLRSNTLPLDCKTYKWSNDISGVCSLCDSGEIEDVKHFLLKCTAFDDIRNEELTNLKGKLTLCDLFDTWTLFSSSIADDKLLYILGADSVFSCDDSAFFLICTVKNSL